MTQHHNAVDGRGVSDAPAPTLAIVPYLGDVENATQHYAGLEEAELRRRALAAASAMEEEELWYLMQSHLILTGLSGAQVSRHTLRAYRQGLSTFLNYAQVAGMSLLRPRPNQGAAYVRWLESQGAKTSTVRVRLAAARRLFATLRWAGATTVTPFADVRPAPDPVPRTEKRKPYSDAEVEALLKGADPEEKVIVLLGAHAGLRISEAASLPRAALYLDAAEPHLVVTGKRRKRQSVPLSRSLVLALRHWLAATPQVGPQVLSGCTTIYIQRRLKALCQRTGVSYAGRQYHGLRHSAGTRLYAKTGDLLAVRDHLRHADITSSEIYVEHVRQLKTSAVADW